LDQGLQCVVRLNTYTFHINFYDLAFLGTVFVGLNFALLLWFAKSINRAANRFLSLALIVIVLWVARLLCIDGRLSAYMPNWNWLPLQFSLALGPLIFFYVLKLTRPEYQFRQKDMLHFSPLLLQLGAHVLEVCESAVPGAATHDTPLFQKLSLVLQLLGFVAVGSYLYLSNRLIERFYRRIRFTSGDRYRHEMRWLRNFLMAFGLQWLLWIPFTAAGYYYQLGTQFYYPLDLLLALMMIWLSASAFLKPEVSTLTDRSLFLKPASSPALKQKGIWLKQTVKANRYHQDPELSLGSLAEKLDLSPHELSRIINTTLKKSFADFINEFRVRDAAAKMQDKAYDHLTLLGIAFESGFNSKTTFNRAFKQVTGKNPVDYKNELKKEAPFYNSGRYPRLANIISDHETTIMWTKEKSNRNYMFRNYLKIAWRNTLRNKGYSAMNIVGLAAGMAVVLLIGLWVVNQFSYDRFLPGYKQLYQVRINSTDPKEGTHTQPSVCIPLANVLRTTIPGIERVAETSYLGDNTRDLKVGDKKFMVSSGDVNPVFIKMFRYALLRGDRNTALNNVYSILIDESTAKALFGNADPMDKTIRIDNQHDVKVTGVFKDIPPTASIKFSCLLPFSYKQLTESWVRDATTSWTNNSFEMFVELQPGATQAQISPKIKDLLIKNYPDYKNSKAEVILQPIQDEHLFSNYENGKVAGGFIDYVEMFSVIGALVLLIACINFMNLSTACSEKRAREVGVRKAIGSQRKDLIFQFLTESLLITFAAFLLSVLLVQLALEPFNTLTGSSVEIPFGNPVFWALMLGYVLFTGLMAGSRPAFYLSSFNPVKVLKGTIQVGKAASLPRKILVVAQFSCSIALIISTVIIYEQLQYAKNRPIGYSSDRLVFTSMSHDLAHNYEALKNDLLQSRMVENVAKASSPLTDIWWHTAIVKWPGKGAGDQGINTGGISVTDNYFKTVGMKLIAGSDFSPDWSNDTLNVIVNQAAVKRMGLQQPLNQLITYSNLTYPVRIIGVVQDAQIESPYTPAEPIVFNHGYGPHVMIYRLAAGINPHTAMEKIGKLFDKYNAAYPFDYVFADQAYDQKFGLEELVGKLAGIFAALAIFISCLGLFGLAAYVAEQRTKEIGIRKVLGASISQVWIMLSRDFIWLVLISCFIASPISLYFLAPWLKKYPYHIQIGPGIFLISAAAALIITLFTISFQAIKAALANPVRSLRSE
jgi:putative ABC transport system permease protein